MLYAKVEREQVEPQLIPALDVSMPDDLQLARCIASCVCAVPGISGMGCGVFALVATYGPGERITGVVLHHLTSTALTVEVHVCLDERTLLQTADVASFSDFTADSAISPVVVGITDHVRDAVWRAIEPFYRRELVTIDVVIDDIK
jgi:hypothetical protein